MATRTMFELLDPIHQRTGRAVTEVLCMPAVAHRYMAHCAAHGDPLYDLCLTGRERSDEAGRRHGFFTYEAQITTAGWLAMPGITRAGGRTACAYT